MLLQHPIIIILYLFITSLSPHSHSHSHSDLRLFSSISLLWPLSGFSAVGCGGWGPIWVLGQRRGYQVGFLGQNRVWSILGFRRWVAVGGGANLGFRGCNGGSRWVREPIWVLGVAATWVLGWDFWVDGCRGFPRFGYGCRGCVLG